MVAARPSVPGVRLVGQVHEPLADELCQRRRAGPLSTVDEVRPTGGAHQELATGQTSIDLAWTDITWLLHAQHVSWAYYVQPGPQPDCHNEPGRDLRHGPAERSTPGIWNPLPAVR